MLKSKLIGGVSHIIDKSNSKESRRIDNWISNNQEIYLQAQEKAKINSKNIKFEKSNSFLMNIFINDILATALNSITNYLSINYEDIHSSLEKISDFLQTDSTKEELTNSFLKKPTIKKTP